MKAREAISIFERAKETGFCVSLRGFAECIGVVPSTIVNWTNNPEKELRGIEATKVQYVKKEVEKYEPESVDWSSFRREAAKDILCALIGDVGTCRNEIGSQVSCSIMAANELIRQLHNDQTGNR